MTKNQFNNDVLVIIHNIYFKNSRYYAIIGAD